MCLEFPLRIQILICRFIVILKKLKSLKEIGEFGFIESFANKFSPLLHNNEVGIGDDCAVFPKDGATDSLFTTDLLAEGIHFIREKVSAYELGYKSVAVNLSDIAAMGGIARGTFLSIAVPPNVSLDYLDEFMNGYLAISREFNVPLLGGDTTKSLRDLVINVGVIGEVEHGKAKMRSKACADDIICVTGSLGDSAGGLQIVLAERDKETLDKLVSEDLCVKYLLDRHYMPRPRLNEGLVLGRFEAVHAMMDISDGIGSDLQHILMLSNVSACVDIDRIPLSSQLRGSFGNKGEHYLNELAISGGEDYELLFTVGMNELDAVKTRVKRQTGTEVHEIGRITPVQEGSKPSVLWMSNGVRLNETFKGYNHFLEK